MMLGERDQLQEALHAVHGTIVKGAVLGAGEIFLEFVLPDDGVWSLGTGGSRWALIYDDQPVVQDTDDPEALERFDLAVGRRVLGLRRERTRKPAAGAFKLTLKRVSCSSLRGMLTALWICRYSNSSALSTRWLLFMTTARSMMLRAMCRSPS